MTVRVGQFEKISLEQWHKDYGDDSEGIGDKILEEIVKIPSRATKGSAGYDIVTPVNIDLKVGDNINVDEFKNKLSELGYVKVSKIDQSLEFASRGEVIDVFSLNYENPIRIQLFDTEIESIRLFEIGTQTSYKNLSSVTIIPANINILNKDEKEHAKNKILHIFEKDTKNLSNYDAEMLTNGLYPEYLKNRIRANNGHLDNIDAAEFLADIYNKHLKYIFLCHLSKDNNTPEKARESVTRALTEKGITVGEGKESLSDNNKDVQLVVLPRYDITPCYHFRVKY